MTSNKKGFPPTFYNFCFLCVKNRGHIFAYSYMCILCSHFIFLFYSFWVTFNLNWNQMKILFSCLLRFIFKSTLIWQRQNKYTEGMRECLSQPSAEPGQQEIWYCTWTWMVYSYPFALPSYRVVRVERFHFTAKHQAFFPLSHHVAFRVLLSRPGIGLTVVKMLSPNHWMVREFHPPATFFYPFNIYFHKALLNFYFVKKKIHFQVAKFQFRSYCSTLPGGKKHL